VALTHKDLQRLFQVKPGRRFKLKRHRPDWAGGGEFKDLRKPELKARSIEVLKQNTAELAEAQERLCDKAVGVFTFGSVPHARGDEPPCI
jgi:hypothetical protein